MNTGEGLGKGGIQIGQLNGMASLIHSEPVYNDALWDLISRAILPAQLAAVLRDTLLSPEPYQYIEN